MSIDSKTIKYIYLKNGKICNNNTLIAYQVLIKENKQTSKKTLKYYD